MRPRKATVSERRILQGIMAEIVGVDTDGGPASYRCVQLLTPSAPAIVFTIDNPTPVAAGPGRVYMLPPAPPGQLIKFMLLPQQRVFGATADGVGMAVLGVVVEYMEDAP